MNALCQVKVNNVPDNPCKYIVARYDSNSLSLWFWGSWDDKQEAGIAAEEITGIVLERVD